MCTISIILNVTRCTLMKKQTVQELYDQQLAQQHEAEPIPSHSLSQVQQHLNAAESAIQQVQQSIRQTQTDSLTNIQPIEQRLTQAIDHIRQIQALEIQSNLGLSDRTYQQFNQLQSELSQAQQTVKVIQKSQFKK